MARNVEIKARVRDLADLEEVARSLEDRGTEDHEQTDTYYQVPHGRLKLRVLAEGSAELIQYDRPDSRDPELSRYVRARVDDPTPVNEALINALGIRAIVRKSRRVFLVGRSRIHLDRVEGLGDFLEVEVVLGPGEAPEEGEQEAYQLMERLGIRRDDLIRTGYVDLLEAAAERPAS